MAAKIWNFIVANGENHILKCELILITKDFGVSWDTKLRDNKFCTDENFTVIIYVKKIFCYEFLYIYSLDNCSEMKSLFSLCYNWYTIY